MKTAMQLMLEDLELRYKVLSNAEMLQACGAIEGTIDYAKSLIIKEKEHLMMAFNDGKTNAVLKKRTSEEYYNQLYE